MNLAKELVDCINEAGEDKPTAGDVVRFDDGNWEVVSWQSGILKLKPLFNSNKSSKTIVGKDFYFEYDDKEKVWSIADKNESQDEFGNEVNPLDEIQQFQQLMAKLDRKPISDRVDLYSNLTGKLFGEIINLPSGKSKVLKIIKEFKMENKI